MKVIIKRFDPSLPLPSYQTGGAAALDLAARLTTTIPAKTVGYIPMNVALQIPENYWVLVAARSSLHKRGLMLANGIGVGDFDFRGNEDEYKAAVYNFTENEVIIEKGERIAQMMVLKRERVEWAEVSELDETSRGGFGSTGLQ